MAFPGLPKEGIAFLAKLARHNEREWFQPRKEAFDETVRLPMAGLVAALNEGLEKTSPEHVVPAPERALSRIYRDVRFAKDKAPYKTNIYAIWPRRGAPRHEGPAFYLSVSGKSVEAGGGLWMPMPPVLARVRAWLDEHHARLRKVVAAAPVKRLVGGLATEGQLARVPRGYTAEHPAADLLRMRHLILSTSWPASLATTPSFAREVGKVFTAIAPFIAVLDEACGLA